ncbi:YheC/YheD family protein [Metabacillus sp. KIGAM252]|uniref:YheC/YheD family protein n=1 Tax=Metabacillus flavus TaxID=2823519 RepID=A0ABS5LAV1_9BACI|nr:YheC/YheD family protein [Metabacillus flavus]MBS2967846.1 YheC/YheD family protein [Metabacillus flavus]
MSKIPRGRWSQYQTLQANENINSYLLKTDLFMEDSFLKNLQHHLTIRPCFGREEIRVSKIAGREDQFKVIDVFGRTESTLSGKKEVYHHLNDLCKTDQFYILQDTDLLRTKDAPIFELLVTVHRDLRFIWQVTDIIEKNGLTNRRQMKSILKMVNDAAIEAALCLVGDEADCSTIIIEFGLLLDKLWIQDIELHFSKSKWSQYQLLSFNDDLSRFLPHTQLATPNTFFSFIKKYRQVMLKPCNGQWGIGVIKVSLKKGGIFEVHSERKKVELKGQQEITDYLQTHYFSKDRYIIQNRIKLGTIDDCIFDARVMVQREDSNSTWEITAKVAKIATKDFIVTNVAKSILLLEEALGNSSNNKRKIKKLLSKIDRICKIGALYLGDYYQDVTCIGMDIGIDHRGRIWIFETNLVPDITLFKRLQDRSIYEKIITMRRKKG